MEKGAKVPDERRVWKEIVEEGRLPPLYKKWTEEDEQRLMATLKSDLTLTHTRFGRAVATKMRELEASVDFMSREERDRIIRKLNKLTSRTHWQQQLAGLRNSLSSQVKWTGFKRGVYIRYIVINAS